MTLQLERVKERLCKINSAQDKERDMYKAGDGRTDETIQSILIRHQDDRTALIRSEQVLTINEVYILDPSQHWSMLFVTGRFSLYKIIFLFVGSGVSYFLLCDFESYFSVFRPPL